MPQQAQGAVCSEYADDESVLDRRLIRAIVRFETTRTGFPIFDEDLEQETLLCLVRAVQRNCTIQYPKAFVAKIVRNVVASHWRRNRRMEHLESIPDHLLSYHQPFESSIDESRTSARLQSCFDELPAETRATIERFYFEEYSIRELALSMQLSDSGVKMILFRGRQQLRKLMDRKP